MASPVLQELTVSREKIVTAILALAVLSSSVVFSEPAPVDMLMVAFIGALCVLGGGRLGPVTAANFVIWLVLLALAFAATPLSPSLGKAITHQAVTLFLVVGAVAMAAFIAHARSS